MPRHASRQKIRLWASKLASGRKTYLCAQGSPLSGRFVNGWKTCLRADDQPRVARPCWETWEQKTIDKKAKEEKNNQNHIGFMWKTQTRKNHGATPQIYYERDDLKRITEFCPKAAINSLLKIRAPQGSFIDLPNISASIYSVELCTRLRSFLKACPPAGPSPPVTDLVISTADFQKDLASWSICPVKGGVDAKELFHLYIILWIQDKRLALLESCRLDKVKWTGVRTQHLTTPFVDEVYDRLKETLNEYEMIMCRWPEYILALENAIADVENAMVEALEKQYADVLTPLKDRLVPKRFGLKYVQKLAKGKNVCPYSIPDELGILLNTMKRLLDVLMPRIEMQLKSWASCIPDAGGAAAGERLSEVAVSLRSKFRNYLQAIVEKLAENTHARSSTNLKKILKESKGVMAESDVRKRMQHLRQQLNQTINHIDKVFEVNVFVSVCRCLWDRLGQDVLKFLENHKENRSLCKASRATVAVLDETFASQMQHLVGNTLQENDLEPPRSIIEVRSILCKDVHKDTRFNYGVRA